MDEASTSTSFDQLDSTAESPSPNGKKRKQKLTRASTACSACRKLKMKCVGGTEDKPCDRCARTGKECFLQERRRKRPYAKKEAEIQDLKAKLKDMEEKMVAVGEGSQFSNNASNSEATHSHPEFLPPSISGNHSNANEGDLTGNPHSDWLQTICSASSDYPQATSSSLHNPSNGALSAPSPVTSINSSQNFAKFEVTSSDNAWLEANSSNLPFLKSESLSIQDSIDLFKLFMINCLPHTIVLDAEFHTIVKVGQTSNGFLLACILFLASAYDKKRERLQRVLQEEMDLLIGKVISSGQKSIEIVQGFLLLYWWTRPSDPTNDHAHAWMYSGIAMRMATNLNLSSFSFGGEKKDLEDGREKRNRERTWLMCWLVDRSLSASVGKQWTIKGDDYICRNSDLWCSKDVHPFARSWDLAISALADLLKTTSRQVDILNTAVAVPFSQTEEIEFDCDTMMRIMNDELVQYRRKWHDRGWIVPRGESIFTAAAQSPSTNSINLEHTDIHTYIYHHIMKQANLRYNYAVLVLNSFGLQYCATHPNHQNSGCRIFCITHAIQASHNIVIAARDGLSSSLSYAPHTQFTILLFGLISLIKLSSLKKDDEVVSKRLIDLVESGINFLEKISLTRTSTPARCSSLLRAILRRKRANDKLNTFEKPAFRPGMEEHHLPQESSRYNSPFSNRNASNGNGNEHENGGFNESGNGISNLHNSSSSSFPQIQPQNQFYPNNHLHHQTSSAVASSSSQPSTNLDHFATSNAIDNSCFHSNPNLGPHSHLNTPQSHPHSLPNSYSQDQKPTTTESPNYSWSLSPDGIIANLGLLPSTSDEDQNYGVFGIDGSLGWDQLTTDEILDDSFWLKLPGRS